MPFMNPTLNRRDFLRQSFAFSALATLGARNALRPGLPILLRSTSCIVGDWGWTRPEGHGAVRQAAMADYAQKTRCAMRRSSCSAIAGTGNLDGGSHSPRW